MSHYSRMTGQRARRPRAALPLLGAVVTLVLIGGCGPGGAGATFDPTGPCQVSGKAPGAYPKLESMLPATFQGADPSAVDSGRNCPDGGLGSLGSHGVQEVQYAGATWDRGGGSAVASVVFEQPGASIPAAWLAEFYETGARAGKKTDNIETSTFEVDGAGEVARVDVLNDLSWQSVATWQDGDRVRAVLVASPVSPTSSRKDHDGLVLAAIEASVAASEEPGGS